MDQNFSQDDIEILLDAVDFRIRHAEAAVDTLRRVRTNLEFCNGSTARAVREKLENLKEKLLSQVGNTHSPPPELSPETPSSLVQKSEVPEPENNEKSFKKTRSVVKRPRGRPKGSAKKETSHGKKFVPQRKKILQELSDERDPDLAQLREDEGKKI